MGTPFLSEIRIASFTFPPKGWAFCNGQLLPINQNQALFSLLGTTYGGDGRVNFALPDLRGRMPAHVGGGLALGQKGGAESVTLTTSQLPAHTHAAAVSATGGTGTVSATTTGFAASAGLVAWDHDAATTTMGAGSVGATGGSQAHANVSPYLGLSFIIALQGVFPSQN